MFRKKRRAGEEVNRRNRVEEKVNENIPTPGTRSI
jgi:hypothetical protein